MAINVEANVLRGAKCVQGSRLSVGGVGDAKRGE
jgi:hypothetical protein